MLGLYSACVNVDITCSGATTRRMREHTQQQRPGEHIPWYTLNPRHIRLRRLLLPLLALLLLSLGTEKHCWRWSWQHGYHASFNCRSVVDVHGRQIEAWRWVEGREIRIYTSPALATPHVQLAAGAVRDLIQELGLDIRVVVAPPPARVTQAIARCTLRRGGKTWVSFDGLCRALIATRDGHYAEMVYVPGMIDATSDVVGAGVFSYGVSILDAQQATSITARHEAGHLLGYHLHDTWPLIVLGYPDFHQAIYHRKGEDTNPLMMPYSDGFTLSARSRDALLCFWHGLEQRTGQHYFNTAE